MSKRSVLQTTEDKIRQRTATVCVVGLGYVGLPLAVEFDREGFDVFGYDIDPRKIEQFRSGADPSRELSDDEIAASEITFTSDPSPVSEADFVIVGVPTPIDETKNPDLEYVAAAGRSVGEHLTKGTTVVLESTVYPGATREILVPATEETSGLAAGEEFFYGYSPERMVPGDSEHGLRNVVKIVSGQDDDVLNDIALLYETIVNAGVYRAPAIEVAETAKVVENAQRDLNIALMNELAVVCDVLGIDTHDVLDAAGTKWNFHEYSPGLVGGHCIPVDPYFFAYRAAQEGFEPELLQTSRTVNESMPDHVAELTIKALNRCHKTLRESRVLVLGLSYKPGVADIRSSKVADVVDSLAEYDVDVAGFDPFADDDAVRDAFDIDVQSTLSFEGFDAILLATPHAEFEQLDLEAVASELEPDPALIDVTGALEEASAVEAGFLYRRV